MNLFRTLLTAVALTLSMNLFAGQPVDINTADAATLADSLDGIGAAKAEAIIAWRKANGPFKSMDQLVEVKGIGLRTVEKNREFIKLAPVVAKR